jgi:5-methylcytosine-specific restriction enzyme A
MGKVYDRQLWRNGYRTAKLAQSPLCEMCKAQGRLVPADHVDHILAIAKGGDPWDMDNLQSLCLPCHSRKTATEDRQRPMRCDARGFPLDPMHHWNCEEIDGEGEGVKPTPRP